MTNKCLLVREISGNPRKNYQKMCVFWP